MRLTEEDSARLALDQPSSKVYFSVLEIHRRDCVIIIIQIMVQGLVSVCFGHTFFHCGGIAGDNGARVGDDGACDGGGVPQDTSKAARGEGELST